MKPFFTLPVAAAVLCGCMSQGEIYSATPQRQFALGENYQAVYARLLRTMKVCMMPGFALYPGDSTIQIDGQLYSDLGYGEITTSLQGMIPVYYSNIRVTRTGAGSELAITVQNMGPGAQAKDLANYERWARGSTDCGD